MMIDIDNDSDSDDELLLLIVSGKKKRQWVHPTNEMRSELGEFHRLVQELKLDKERFHCYFRMSQEQYGHLVDVVGPKLYRQTTNFREPISVEQRLAITLR